MITKYLSIAALTLTIMPSVCFADPGADTCNYIASKYGIIPG